MEVTLVEAIVTNSVRNVVSTSNHKLIPSIPTAYCKPKLGTQETTSANWKLIASGAAAAWRGKFHNNPTESTKLSAAVNRATNRAALSSFFGTSNSAKTPTSGLAINSDSSEEPVMCMTSFIRATPKRSRHTAFQPA